MMESAPVIASPRSFPSRPSLGNGRVANDPAKLSLRMASSTGSMEKKDGVVHGTGAGSGSGGAYSRNSSIRQRRRKRLVDKSRNANASPRPSPPTISEHQSMEHSKFEKEKLSLSADATAETTMLSTETPETTPQTTPESKQSDKSIRVTKVPSTPPTKNGLHAKEKLVPLPQSILTTKQTFPPPEKESTPQIQRQLAPKNSPPPDQSTPNDLSQSTPDGLSQSASFPRRQRSGSLWSEAQLKQRSTSRQQKPIRKIPTAPVLSAPFDEPRKRLPKTKIEVLSTRPKPKFQRHSTAPASQITNLKQTTVVDDVLMDRAFVIRQDLMNFEMEELAAEAEKAAESGLEKFVGSTSKFGVEETPPYRPRYIDDAGEFIANPSNQDGRGNVLMTPSRRNKSFVDTLTQPMDYTPSYFSRKKIPVTSLRNFSEIVPNFTDMHNNIRLHLGREGVDRNVLPELHSRRSLMKNDTDDTDAGEKEDGEADAISQAPSVAASHADSTNSFSSYAAASLVSMKEMIEFVNQPRSPVENAVSRPSSSMSNVSQNNLPDINHNLPEMKEPWRCSPLRDRSRDHVNFTAETKRGGNLQLPLLHATTHFKPAVPSFDADSDDSSVEFYGRKSPVDISNQSISSNMSNRIGVSEWKPSMTQSFSNLSSPSGELQQPLLQRNRSNTSGYSVSFETEKASYRALLDKMHHKTSPSVSFDVDQTGCAPSLTNIDLDILQSTTSPSSNKSTPMASFLTKLGKTFSRSTSPDAHQNSPKAIDEGNKHFVSNFFYTNATADPLDMNSAPNLKLDINAQSHRDPYCLSGCGANEVLSACDTATKYADVVFDWFGVKGGNQRKNSSAIIDPNSSEAALNRKWMKTTWQQSEELGRSNSSQRVFTPPKLSLRHTEEIQESNDIFCSPDSTSIMGNECDDPSACPEVQEPMTCPVIENGCSPPSHS